MIDVDSLLRSELDRLVPIDSRRDWDAVAAGAGLRRQHQMRRWTMAAAIIVLAALVGLGTPLGAALVRSLDDFSAWLTGQPGTPASQTEQQAFEEANARTWLHFPKDTQLRHLISAKADGSTIELLGFRSGTSALCLRLHVTGKAHWATLHCAPLAELRRAGGPARPVMVDEAIGKGNKSAWYGIDRFHSSSLQITAGIVTDSVRSVVLDDDAGRHEVRPVANAFLYIAETPDVGQRVKRIWARTDRGLIPIPFVPTPFGFGGGPPTRPAPPAPVVERQVNGGRVGWLEQRESRGEPLDVLPAGIRAGILGRREGLPHRPTSNVLYGRVLTPDPDRPARIVLTLNANRPDGPAEGLCTWFVTKGSSGGGCAAYPGTFKRTLIPGSLSSGGSGAFVTLSGVASDDVARIEALLADGQQADVPFKDNAFMVDLPGANLPARLIAYDSAGRVIDVGEPWADLAATGGGPVRGRAKSLLRASGPGGATAELLVGPSNTGGECRYTKHFIDRHHRSFGISCMGPTWTGQALQLGSDSSPPRFIDGRVRPDIKKVRIRFADGSTTLLIPTRGYVLWAASKAHLDDATAAVEAEGLGADGSVVARESFKAPRRSP
jgi:hypothetical protein